MIQTFPFTAIVGHESLKLALLLNAIDSSIGGVVVSGPRGSAKSTLARGLADVAGIALEQFVTLPLGATEERVVGTLDVEKVLQNGELKFSPGILHQAHEGILYVDEVNLLPDPIVDLLLDVAASGINVIERDGVSKRHPARFVLIGTMNPDEGELRPQLLDRFGLCVEMDGHLDIEQRMQVVERRISFDSDPATFLIEYNGKQQQLREKIEKARSTLINVNADDDCKRYICEICQQSQVDGVRADLTLFRTAIAYAAWLGEKQLEKARVDEVAEFVLCHRRKVSRPSTNPMCEDDRQRIHDPSQNKDQDLRDNNSGQEDPYPQGEFGEMPPVSVSTGAARDIKPLLDASKAPGPKKKVPSKRNSLNHAGSRRRFVNLSSQQEGLNRISTPQCAESGPINWHSSLLKSASKAHLVSESRYKPSVLPLRLSEIIRRGRINKTIQLNLILLDISASTLAATALQQAKAVVNEINIAAYLNRDRIAIMTFGNDEVKMLLPPSRSTKDLGNTLDEIYASGGTPLREGLLQANRFLQNRYRSEANEIAILYIITDGRSNDDISDLNINTMCMFIDMELGQVRLNRGWTLSKQLDAEYIHVEDIPYVSDHLNVV